MLHLSRRLKRSLSLGVAGLALGLLAGKYLQQGPGKASADGGAAAAFAAVVSDLPGNQEAAAPPQNGAEIQRHRSLGKAYYEQGKYPEAIAEFQKVIASGRAVALDHLALGQSLMQANNLDQALGELTTARQMDPTLTSAMYNLGILYKRELRYPQAEQELKQVIQVDAGDPPTWFNLASVYFSERKLTDSLAAYKRVVEMGFGKAQNFYVAATFHCFIINTRLRQNEEAKKYLALNKASRDKVPGISLQYPALEAGKYGAVRIPPPEMLGPPRRLAAAKVSFDSITSHLGIHLPATDQRPGATADLNAIPQQDFSLDYARRRILPRLGASIAVGDFDGDGYPDLYVVIPGAANHLFRNNGDGSFTDVTAKAGVAGDGNGVSAAFGDYDNSGHLSLAVAGLGGLTLYRNKGDGTFEDVTAKAHLKGNPGELDTDVVAVDSDNDGSLDFVVTAYADLGAPPQKASYRFPNDFPKLAPHLYRNNGDGTFSDVAAKGGLPGATQRLRGAVFGDFNNDGYADLVFLADDAAPLLYLNHGEDKFTAASAQAGADFAAAPALDARVADFNHDGLLDLALATDNGWKVLLNRGGARFTRDAHLPAIKPYSGTFRYPGAVLDADGDSFDDLLIADANGRWRLLSNTGHSFKESPLELPLPAGQLSSRPTMAWVNNPGKLDILAVTKRGQVAGAEKSGPPSHWVEVRFDGYKSNKAGAGAVVELKAGNFYDKVVSPGGPVRIFTGEIAKLDVVRVTWPNQVVQNSINVTTGKPVLVRESERLASSCPFLYVWNGRRYVFFTDILGASPIGELLPDGSRMKPNPVELVRLGDAPKPQNGDYTLQITSEMREVDYFDQLKLLAVDHPPAETVLANEIYSSTPVVPRLYALRNQRFPIAATDDHGDNVLPLLLKADGRYPTNFRRDRILGLSDLHSLTLDLGDFPRDEKLALWLKGWVFWTDSNASRALMNNRSLRMVAPYLQVRDQQGRWVTVIPDMGLPSGANRTMRVDLTGKFLTRDHHVRIVTNFCVYWDQIFYTTDEVAAPAAVALPLLSADLHYRGFSRYVYDPRHIHPDYFDYARLLTAAPWNPMRGKYTRYGAVKTLLASADDQLVTMSTGDEMTVKFGGRGLPPLKPGWRRDFFLMGAGYAKDGEPNTAYASSVEPLPFRAMPNYPPVAGAPQARSTAYQQYLHTYETRSGLLLIPPLAPPAGN